MPSLKRKLTRRAAQISTWVDSDGPVQFPDFVASRRIAKEHGHPLPNLMPEYHNVLFLERPRRSRRHLRWVLRERQRVHDELVASWPDRGGQIVGEYTGDIIDDDGQFASRYLYAFWRLCTQRIVTVDRRGDLDERTPGLRPVDDEQDIRVVRLRSFSPHDDNVEPSGRHHRHRWIVRMHKVRQWYPSAQTHKVLWRGPYVKGPAGAPLLNEERVNALVR